MRKLIILLIAVIALTSVIGAGMRVQINPAEEPFSAEVLDRDGIRTVLKYTVNAYDLKDIKINGQGYTEFLKLPKEGMIEEAGYPRLPQINRAILIPDEGVMGWQVISADYIEIDNINIAPSKGHLPRTVDLDQVPHSFAEIYNRDAFFPEEIVSLRDPHIVRDYRGLVVELNVFRYNPVKRVLRIYTNVTIEVSRVASGGVNEIHQNLPRTAIDRQFHKVYQRHFVNYDELDYVPLLESGSLLVICHDTFLDLMEPFVEWKNQKGLYTEMVPISQVGSNPTEIQNYVRDYYNQSDLVYLLLVGDHAQIPTFSSGSDPVYGLLSGGDNYPEIFVGRFSAETRDQVVTQVTRTITYEKYPDPTGDWYSRGLGDADESGPCNPEPYDFQHITNIALDLVRWNYTQVDSVYTTFGGTTQMIMDFMDAGVSIFNYAGHGWTNMVGPVNFYSSNADQLVNDNKLFHFVAVACESGNFLNTTCIAEVLLRATNNTSGEPTGAIGCYLSKISQSWFPPYDMQDEGVDLICADSMLTFGGMCFNGSMLMMDLHGAGGENEFRNWTIFGDPSFALRSMTPYDLTVSSNPTIPLGTSSYSVTVNGPGGPLEEALVCAMNEEIYATGYTNSSGQVNLAFDPPPTQPGTLTLTVTTSNSVPYITDVYIIVPSGAYVIYNDHVVQDDLTGNNNGQLDYAETVELQMTVENVGVAEATNVTGTISTDDVLVTVNQSTANFGNIPEGGTSTIDRAFEFAVAPEVTDGHPIAFMLTADDGVNSWESFFTVNAHAPDVIFSQLEIDDAAGGNGNGNLDPGETADLQVTIVNDGSSNVDDVESSLSCADPYMVINSAVFTVGSMAAGAEAQADFNVTVSPSCPQEHQVDFDVAVTGALGYANTTGFSTIVGDITYMPTGPDNYGYMAYDHNDAPEFPEYNWVEICPDSGGPGTLVPFISDEQVFHFELPFTFGYYGAQYDSFTVAANGWVGMGVVGPDDYSNSGIPNADGPRCMIASYWEDLSPQRNNSGGVWTWYDDAENLLIIEYNHIEQYAPEGNFETFQTVLYDPSHYPTFTGDGRIKVQYKDMSNSSTGEGTVGIENHDQTDGIQYFFDGSYDEHASSIVNESAILYTTPMSIPQMVVEVNYVLGSPIPATGGDLFYGIWGENQGSVPLNWYGWIDMVYENQDTTLIILRSMVNYQPGWQINRPDVFYPVPESWPGGNYDLVIHSGNYPTLTVWYQDSFPWFKDGTTDLGFDFAANLPTCSYPDPFAEVIETTTKDAIPDQFEVLGTYPNPFNPSTVLRFQLPDVSPVNLAVYDISGRLVAELINGWRDAGVHEVTFDASDLASGIYLYRIEAGEFSASGKMVLLK
ncbi:hypothetical protein CEE37_01740 [candidate division LCP-89 bacterium B3_LCP]|uniref:Gingipain R n=1 Tax=candidate division LCP-89 bacterium B3_LCP TaxID=2012998 RepID=A0A532V5G1_UNCL8|nr:MAG: hypothetical protein CEE37_01740 [candidate division LCP-89 bacterium B3_LCP]